MVSGKQIRVYLVDGTPGGLLTAEIMNWTGHVVAAPRSDIADLLAREEVRRTVSTSCWAMTPSHSRHPEKRST